MTLPQHLLATIRQQGIQYSSTSPSIISLTPTAASFPTMALMPMSSNTTCNGKRQISRPQCARNHAEGLTNDIHDVDNVPTKRRRLSPVSRPGDRDLPLPDDCPSSSPDDYLQMLIKAVRNGRSIATRSAAELREERYIEPVTEKQLQGYLPTIVKATRMNDFDTLREQLTAASENEGEPIYNYCNRFGESLLHISCRRGYREIFEFLNGQDQVTLRCTDDGGRTPLHDACWHPEAQIEICTDILRTNPELMLVRDNRGYTPFEYSRREHWTELRRMLYDNREQLKSINWNKKH